MRCARPIFAKLAIPTIAISGDPGIKKTRKLMNSRDQEEPGDQLPARQRKSDARPGVHAAVNAARRIHRLHEPHRLFAIHLGKASRGLRIMQIEELNPTAMIHAPDASNTGAAKGTAAIIEDGQHEDSITPGNANVQWDGEPDYGCEPPKPDIIASINV